MGRQHHAGRESPFSRFRYVIGEVKAAQNLVAIAVIIQFKPVFYFACFVRGAIGIIRQKFINDHFAHLRQLRLRADRVKFIFSAFRGKPSGGSVFRIHIILCLRTQCRKHPAVGAVPRSPILVLTIVIHGGFKEHGGCIETVSQSNRRSILHRCADLHLWTGNRRHRADDRSSGRKNSVVVQKSLAAGHQVADAGNDAETTATSTGDRRVDIRQEICVGIKFLGIGLHGSVDDCL